MSPAIVCNASAVVRQLAVTKTTLLAVLAILWLAMTGTEAIAACPVTYTFSNGTTADATQVNTNFADVAACAGASSLWTVSGSNLVPTSTSYNVGIGTTSAGAKLYVDGNIYATGSISCGGTCGSGGSSGTIFSGTTGQIPYYAFNGNTVTATSSIFIGSTGFVGIGTTSPSRPLQIVGSNVLLKLGSSTSIGSGIYAELDAVSGTQVGISFSTAGATTWLQYRPGGSTDLRFYTGSSDKLTLQSGGNVGIGTTSPSYLLHVNGTAYATGAAGALSDVRHKSGISSLEDGVLSKVMRLRPVSFSWKNPKDDGMKGKQVGFVAQEVEKVFPTTILTQRNSEKTKGLKYNELVPILTKALQEQQTEIQSLRTARESQSARFSRLQGKVGELERTISVQAAGLERLRAEMSVLLRNASLVPSRKVATVAGGIR